MEVHKFWNLTKRRGRRAYGFPNLVDMIWIGIAKKLSTLTNVHDPSWLEAH